MIECVFACLMVECMLVYYRFVCVRMLCCCGVVRLFR